MGADAPFDAWVQSRPIERVHELVNGVLTPAATPMMAACPFVDVTTSSGVVRVGEILRSVQFAPARQALVLPPTNTSQNTPLEVRISEEKREVTYLDFITVDVGGDLRLPRSCEGSTPPAYCVADGIYRRIKMGEGITLSFDVEPDHSGTLVREGFCEPY